MSSELDERFWTASMPILEREPNLFPQDVLQVQPADVKWWAMYTLSRQEKTLMRHLHAHSIAYYSPIVLNRYRSPAGRTRVSYLPLFNNYVFIRGTEDDRYTALTSHCISNQISISDSKAFLRELCSIQLMLSTGRSVTVEPTLQPGDQVRIKSGPMIGTTGKIIQRQGESRLIVAMTFMQQGVSVSIEDWEIEHL